MSQRHLWWRGVRGDAEPPQGVQRGTNMVRTRGISQDAGSIGCWGEPGAGIVYKAWAALEIPTRDREAHVSGGARAGTSLWA